MFLLLKGRSIDPAGRINSEEMREMNNLLAREVARFKASLRDDFSAAVIQALPIYTDPVSRPMTSTGPSNLAPIQLA